MDEIISVPNSLRSQISNAQNLLAQSQQAQHSGNSELAIVRAKEGLKAIRQVARQNPELGALLIAAELGHSGIEWTTFEQIDSYEVLEQKFFGIGFGSKIVPTTKTTRTQRTLRFI